MRRVLKSSNTRQKTENETKTLRNSSWFQCKNGKHFTGFDDATTFNVHITTSTRNTRRIQGARGADTWGQGAWIQGAQGANAEDTGRASRADGRLLPGMECA